jgi:hypothetical protein
VNALQWGIQMARETVDALSRVGPALTPEGAR